MSITLNGIAQGFAADRAMAVLKSHRDQHALINTGEVAMLGRNADGKPWTAGIQHPRRADAYVAVTELRRPMPGHVRGLRHQLSRPIICTIIFSTRPPAIHPRNCPALACSRRRRHWPMRSRRPYACWRRPRHEADAAVCQRRCAAHSQGWHATGHGQLPSRFVDGSHLMRKVLRYLVPGDARWQRFRTRHAAVPPAAPRQRLRRSHVHRSRR